MVLSPNCIRIHQLVLLFVLIESEQSNLLEIDSSVYWLKEGDEVDNMLTILCLAPFSIWRKRRKSWKIWSGVEDAIFNIRSGSDALLVVENLF